MRSMVKAGRRTFAAEIVGAVADGDHIECVITWKGGLEATLVEVRDNSDLVPIVATPGKGRIEISYDSPKKGSHNVECALEFPGSTLQDLKLTGRNGTGGMEELDSKD